MIRPARPEDANAIRRLVLDAYGHYVLRMGKPPGPMLENYDRGIADGQAWVIEEDSGLAGVLVLEDAKGGALLLDNVAVAPSAQSNGYGRALVAFAEEEARRRKHSVSPALHERANGGGSGALRPARLLRDGPRQRERLRAGLHGQGHDRARMSHSIR